MLSAFNFLSLTELDSFLMCWRTVSVLQKPAATKFSGELPGWGGGEGQRNLGCAPSHLLCDPNEGGEHAELELRGPATRGAARCG